MASMPTARTHLAVGVINDGTLYAVGGQNSGGALTTTEAYHHWTNTWTTEPSMPTARSGLAAAGTLSFPLQLWAFGGDDAQGHFLSTVEDYNPKLATWRKRVDLPTPSTGLAATVFVDQGRPVFYTIGGSDGVDLNAVESLDVNP